MTERDDHALLREYAETGSEPAFATLVERYLNLVHSAALRRTGNPHAAGEIAQAVFIILARKAAKLGRKTILSGWLYQTAQLTAANYLRGEIRRQRREQEAFMQSTLNEPADDWAWRQISPQLDEAMADLGECDRNAIVLRYFENKSLREVGTALGASEDAAKMRVIRALEKLRKLLGRRGVALTTVIIAGAVSASSVQAAPVGLAATISAVAITKGAAAGGSTLALVKGALKIMAWIKAKTAVVSSAVLLLAAGTATVAVKEYQEHRTYSWQIALPNSDEGIKALDTAPPQVTIVRSKFSVSQPYASLCDDIPPKEKWRYIGIHATPSDLVIGAYQEGFPLLSSQIIFPSNMPAGFYDYIANLANGSQQALQELIKKKFGLVGKYEMKDMAVLLLKVEYSNAPGLKPGTPQVLSGLVTHGLIHNKNISITRLAKDLGWDLKIPVIDQTGLVGNYDFDFPENLGVTPAEKLQTAKHWLFDQLGLELVFTNMPIEMLVIERAKN